MDTAEGQKDVPVHNHAPVTELIEDKSGKAAISEEELVKVRAKKAVNWLKKNYSIVSYAILAIIVWISVSIRTRNLAGLRDVSTGTWTLGPDLDPFLFLRWSKEIVATGGLAAVDNLRYVPLGFKTGNEYLLHPYLMAWFHNIASIFGTESVTHSAVLYPAFMFGLTVIAFFFMARQFFIKDLGIKAASAIALIGSFLISVIPVLLPRTIAGIPEKESASFLFIFLAFYFFTASWQSKGKYKRLILAGLSVLATTAVANIWGGYQAVFIVLGPAVTVAFFLGKVGWKEFQTFGIWLVGSITLMALASPRHSFNSQITDITNAVALLALSLIVIDYIIYKTDFGKKLRLKQKFKIPPKIITLISTIVVLAVLGTVMFGIDFIPSRISIVIENLVNPATSRLTQTVAENRQPYFNEWAGNFGPGLNIAGNNLLILFWTFFLGSVYLFWRISNVFKTRERVALTGAYVFMLSGIIFSRMSSGSIFNGENALSLLFYASGFITFLGVFGYYYWQLYKKNALDKLKNANFELILILVFFFLGIVLARAAVRTIMVLAIPAAIIASYFAVALYVDYKKNTNKTKKLILLGAAIIVFVGLLFTANIYYNAVKSQAQNYVPSAYTQQWQYAMGWVRENVAEDAVFGHWWDYGYWVQSIGERATILDGGNAISYWNHLMGRHALTSSNERDALEFLYSHGGTHFLIDSTDIGKYTAFSGIGSDVSYDRRSWIVAFQRDNNQILEAKNRTLQLYTGGTLLDGDLVYETDDGRQILLPAQSAGIGAVRIEIDDEGNLYPPVGIYVYQGAQYELAMRYAYINDELIDFGQGLEAGVFMMPRIVQNGGQISIEPNGALFYMSPRTVQSQLARIYLYGEEEGFKLVHSEDDAIVKNIKSQGADVGSFVYYNGFRGPLKIWEIEYPEDIEVNEDYLNTQYPEELGRLFGV